MLWAIAIFAGVGVLFFALAKAHARPGFNALALGACLALTPLLSGLLPLRAGERRDIGTFVLLLLIASVGTALGGGLKPHLDDEHHHDDHAHNGSAPPV